MNCNPIISVQDVKGKMVYMGVFTTFNARSVTFDFSAWATALGEGTFSVSLVRPGESIPYTVMGLAINGTQATWTFDATDTALAGYGQAYLSYVTPDALDMTVDFSVYIARNSAPTGDTPPDPYESWYQRILEASSTAQKSAEDADEDRQAIENMTVSSETLEAGAEATVEKSIVEGVVHLLFGLPHGDKGVKGDKGDTGVGIVSIEKTATSGLVDTYTVTLSDESTYTLTVTNGAKGDKGERGERGEQGIQGIQGEQGIQGVQGEKGEQGAVGVGIQSIVKTSSVGLVDTYTITLTNGTTATFTVTNGAKGDKGDTGDKGDKGDKGDTGAQGIQGIQGEKGDTGATGATGATGNGISSIVKTSTVGLVDTYTITYTDGTSTTYTITNGKDGEKGDKGDDYELTYNDKVEIASLVPGMVVVNVSGTTPVIIGEDNHRYICGEVTTIDITPPASGICDVIFTSGSTAAVLTLTGATMPEWFDSTSLEANTTYELNIMDGYGTVASW